MRDLIRCAPVCVAAFLTYSAPAAGQGSVSDSAAVAAVHARWFAALLAEDTVVLSPILAPDVTLAFPRGNTVPRADYLRYLQDGRLLYDSAEHHEQRIRVYDGAAVITGKSTLTFRFQGKPGSERLAYTATYIKTAGTWRMVAWQSTVARAQE